MKNKDSVSGLAPVNQLLNSLGFGAREIRMQRPPLLLTSCMISGEHFAFLCLVFFICKM